MKAFRKSGAYAGLVLIIAVFLLPFYIMFYLSLSGPADSIAQEWFPRAMLFQNFADAWSKADMGRALMNSLMISIGAIAVLIFCAACGGYAAARVRSRWNRAVFHVMVLSMMVPGIINTVPLYIIMRKINGINSHWAMMLLLACQFLPFSVFLYEGFIRSMNQSVEEAAVIDGCTKFSAFWRVTFPLLKPITATVVIMQGVGIWNNYAQAVFFLQNQNYHTLPLAISTFFQTYGADYNLLAAGAIIGLAPVVLMFILFQKQFVKGLSSGAVKG